MKTMAWKMVGEVLVTVHTRLPPSDADWDAWVEESTSWRPHGVLVLTPGVGPNVKQRRRMHDKCQTAGINLGKLPTAVVCDGTVVRGIVTALSWLGQTAIRSFSPSRLDDAL